MLNWLKSPASETQVTHGQRLWLYAFAAIIMMLLVLPTLIVIPMSFSDSQYLEFPPETWSLRWYRNYFGSAEWMQATATSLKTAVLTMLVATPIGVLAAYALHASRLPYIRAAFVLLITPMMVPVVLIAVGAFYAYVKLQILYTITGLVLAHSLLAIPGGDNPTLTRNMFNALRDQIDPTIAAISTIMILITTLMMVLVAIFGRGKT